MNPQRMLTVPEAAKELRIGRDSAYALIHEGRLRAIRFGRTIRVPRDALDRFIAQELESTGVKGRGDAA